jgi:hypothetical protein
MAKSLKGKLKQASKGKLQAADIQHMKRLGVAVPVVQSQPDRQMLKQVAAWWETMPFEKFLKGVAFSWRYKKRGG